MEIITTKEQLDLLLAKPGRLIVRFTAQWCGPCKQFAPAFKEVAEQDTSATYGVIDADDQRQLAVDMGVRGLPSVLFFLDGHEIGRVAGAMTADRFREVIKQTYER